MPFYALEGNFDSAGLPVNHRHPLFLKFIEARTRTELPDTIPPLDDQFELMSIILSSFPAEADRLDVTIDSPPAGYYRDTIAVNPKSTFYQRIDKPSFMYYPRVDAYNDDEYPERNYTIQKYGVSGLLDKDGTLIGFKTGRRVEEMTDSGKTSEALKFNTKFCAAKIPDGIYTCKFQPLQTVKDPSLYNQLAKFRDNPTFVLKGPRRIPINARVYQHQDCDLSFTEKYKFLSGYLDNIRADKVPPANVSW